ncbi:MAG: biotin--[acetyl-CoA-carboxylase] ligase [Actinomycetia bacterium]|nr:biotin--[acetyl-CoA-carboxylase] ligase [Actinomycetes bacterium]
MNDFNLTLYKKNLNTVQLGKPILYFNFVDSTNSYAAQLEKITDSIAPGTVLLADIQTRGRGKLEAEWVSPAGGLYFTLAVKKELKHRDLPKMTLIAAYAAARAVNALYKLQVAIKWPNDLYCKGKKLAGILTETENGSQIGYINIGTGINVNTHLSDLKKYGHQSTSISQQLNKKVAREKLLAEIINNFEQVYFNFLKTKDFAALFEKIETILIY